MKSKSNTVIALLVASLLSVLCSGCSDRQTDVDSDSGPDPSTSTYGVVGEIHFSGIQCGNDFDNIDGTMSVDGAEYYGYYERTGDDLEFAVGTADRPDATASTDFYLLVRGIAGPPVEGVEGTDGWPKDDEANYTTFGDVLLKNVNEFEFELGDEDDFSMDGLCDIMLFAEPVAGELNPNQEEYDYFVAMDCGAIEAEAATDETIVLNYLEFQFYFSET